MRRGLKMCERPSTISPSALPVVSHGQLTPLATALVSRVCSAQRVCSASVGRAQRSSSPFYLETPSFFGFTPKHNAARNSHHPLDGNMPHLENNPFQGKQVSRPRFHSLTDRPHTTTSTVRPKQALTRPHRAFKSLNGPWQGQIGPCLA